MSSKPSKVRKRFFVSPLHVKSIKLSSSLSKELNSKYGVGSLRLRKGDVVKVMRGEYKDVEGKITGLYTKSGKVTIEGVTREKTAGGTSPFKIHASKLMVVNLNLDDRWRKGRVEKSSRSEGAVSIDKEGKE